MNRDIITFPKMINVNLLSKLDNFYQIIGTQGNLKFSLFQRASQDNIHIHIHIHISENY